MIHRYVLRDRSQTLSEGALYEVLRAPIVTEKSTLLKEKGHYFFTVAPWANCFFIKKAVEKIFQVTVKSVNTSWLKGKRRRFRGKVGVRSDVKKAMVILQEGHKIHLEGGSL